MEEKKHVDWEARERSLQQLIDQHIGRSDFDCIVTVSGGKDGSYVAHTLKTRYGVRPLCLTIRPPLSLKIGDQNLEAFVASGFEHVHVTVNNNAMRKLDKIGFTKYGQGYYGWLISIHTAVLRIAQKFNINLVFYSEDGEIEYGGSTANKNTACYDIEYMKRAYLNDTYEDVVALSCLGRSELYWFSFPEEEFSKLDNLKVTHFSFYENWDPYRNYLVAKEFCGLRELEESVTGTFTNFAQNDQELAALHYYLMYLKFGFGRATQDVGIEIRRGAMTREQGVNLIKLYDNQPPTASFQAYANYFDLNLEQFHSVIDKFANRELFKKVDDTWVPKFEIN